MPFRNAHNCSVNLDVTEVVERRVLKTKWGDMVAVIGRKVNGSLAIRSIQIPVSVPVSIARELCQARGGRLEPSTPLDPKKQLLDDSYGFTSLKLADKKEYLRLWISDLEFDEVKLSGWSEDYTVGLPDSCFLLVLGGGKRHLPYKDEMGRIDENQVSLSLRKIATVGLSADLKRAGLAKLIRLSQSLGLNISESERLKLSDLDFYLEQLELLGE
jgi:hypothetical protein